MGDEGGAGKASPQRAHERSVVRRGAAFLQASEQKRPNPRFAALGQMSNVPWHASHVRTSRVRRARPLHRREQKRPMRAPARNSRRRPHASAAHALTTIGLRIEAATQAGEQNRLAVWRGVTRKSVPHRAQRFVRGSVRGCAA